jgi:hypothetical protein
LRLNFKRPFSLRDASQLVYHVLARPFRLRDAYQLVYHVLAFTETSRACVAMGTVSKLSCQVRVVASFAACKESSLDCKRAPLAAWGRKASASRWVPVTKPPVTSKAAGFTILMRSVVVRCRKEPGFACSSMLESVGVPCGWVLVFKLHVRVSMTLPVKLGYQLGEARCSLLACDRTCHTWCKAQGTFEDRGLCLSICYS